MHQISFTTAAIAWCRYLALTYFDIVTGAALVQDAASVWANISRRMAWALGSVWVMQLESASV
jgi:vacuolar-type H+-ATPase catalytic subunit A/Vma1